MSTTAELIPAVKRCIAQTNKGNVCGAPTVDPLLPFCYNHLKVIGSVKRHHPRYEKNLPENITQEYDWQLQDANPKDLAQEIAMTRAILSKIYEKIKDTDGMMTDADMKKIFGMHELLRRMSDTQARINPDKVVLITDVLKIITDVIQVIRANLPNEMVQVRERIVADINRVCVGELMEKAGELVYSGDTEKIPHGPEESTHTATSS